MFLNKDTKTPFICVLGLFFVLVDNGVEVGAASLSEIIEDENTNLDVNLTLCLNKSRFKTHHLEVVR